MDTSSLSLKRPLVWLAVIMAINAALTIGAMRRTSSTFDEIVMMAAGARGYHTGEWDLAPEHPPGVQYLYGIPLAIDGVDYFPDERGIPPEAKLPMGYRYRYAQEFFFGNGVPSERLIFLGRLPAAACALALIALAFFFTRRAAGDRAAVIAAMLVAFLPDLLAHGGVAYNDVPVTVAIFASVWLIDRALRDPTWKTGLAAGASIGLALGIKNSAVALGPIALLLLVMEIARSWRDAEWRRRIAFAALFTVLGTYLALVIIYRGDFSLAEYRYAINFTFGQVTEVARAPSYLFGRKSLDGWWYYFPVVFLLKTSAGVHVLMALALAAFAAAIRRNPRAIIASRLRAPLAASVVFGALLITAKLDIGFRYALPVVPFLMVLTAAGVSRMWSGNDRRVRGVIVAASAWLMINVASYYPYFLAYVSEYGPGRDRNYELLADSSLDWGQGLIELRDFMKEHNIDRILLSYFGSAMPHAYGIDYAPLQSFYPLKQPANRSPVQPEWIAISATNLTGTYFVGDPYRKFRETRPDYVLGHNMYIYHIGRDPGEAK